MSKDTFFKALRTGCTRATAARSAGLTLTQVNQWIMEGKSLGDPEHVAFLHELERIEAQLELLCHATVIKSAQQNPKWASWWIGHKRRAYDPKPPDVLPVELTRLKPKHQRFILGYVCGETRGNASKSYKAAGYAERAANVNASRLLNRPEIQEAVKALTASMKATLRSSDILDGEERERICAEIARDPEYPPRARLAAVRLSAELSGGMNQRIEYHDIVVDLVKRDKREEDDASADDSK